MSRVVLVTTILTLSAGLTCSSAVADAVSVRFQGTGLSRTLDVSGSVFVGSVSAGQLMHEFAATTDDGGALQGVVATFCTELNAPNSTSWNMFQLGTPSVPASPAPYTGDTSLGALRVAALESLYAGAAGQQHTSADWAAAFQAAVWEIVYDYDGTPESINTATGSVRFSSTEGWFDTVASLVNDHLRSMASARQSYRALQMLYNGDLQDQLVVVAIPLPGPAAMGAAGLLCLFGWRYRRSRIHQRD